MMQLNKKIKTNAVHAWSTEKKIDRDKCYYMGKCTATKDSSQFANLIDENVYDKSYRKINNK